MTETNTLGLKKTYSYDSYGRLKTIKDHKGAITEYTYDSFGREKSIIYPTSNIKRIFYSWDSNNENGVYSISENIDGKPRNITYFDALNRVTRLGEVGINGILRSTDILYDSFGNIWKESNPYIGATATDWNTYTYDVYDRQIGYNEASGKNTTYSYSNNAITINDGSNTSTKKFDVFGNLISVSDSSGTINYSYNANGQLTSINTLSGSGISIEYDNYCRKISLTDPSLGNIKYSYDSAGNLFKETDSNGNSIQYIYDSHNRLAQIIRNEFSTLYHYDAFGDMDSIQNSNGTGTHYIYDYIGRITQSKEYATDGIWLKKDYTYTSGNVSKICYTTHKGVLATENYYYSFGNLYEVKLDDKTSIFKIEKENSFGYPTEILTGNITRKYNYSNFGFPSKRIASSTSKIYQDFSYNFDNKTGNLISRKDNIHDLEESFEYDSLNRLVAYGNQTINYDKFGNITQKSDVGIFDYSLPSKPYAVTGIDLTSDAISPVNQSISYSSFSRPLNIKEGENTISFDYNSCYDRVKMTKKINGTESTNYYLGGCYKASKTNPSQVIEYLYLGGDYYSAPAILQKNSLFFQEIDSIPPYIRLENNLSTIPSEKGIDLPVPSPVSLNKHLYFVLRDYLGSVTHIIESDGSLKQELSYDAWGRMRDSSTWETYSYENESQPMFGRGYCGHEHIRVGGLINMNARLYDPALGRFLSPDPFIQFKDWSQNLNRYTYALNNPLYYIDEDGQLFWFAVGGAALIGGAFNVWSNWNSIVSAGGWKGVWQGTKYFLVGAVAGGASAAVGLGVGSMLGVTATSLASASSSIMSSVLINSSEGAVNGFLLGSLNSLVNGDDWKTALQEGAENGAFEALAGAATSVATIGAKSIAPKKNRNYQVYYGYDSKDKVRYVGITRQDPEVRFAQHRRSKNPDGTPTDRSSLHFVVQEDFGKMTKMEARIWEQQQINLFKLKKNGGDLFNKRNEIRMDLWEKYGIKP
ncbi:MAG: hypothetical protein K2K25_02800 [Muribaculaceae bacterium]|nr:hypothetical protein [Muribaculaceae bacterium]